MTGPPEGVRRLAEERAAARAAGDFEAADELRRRLADRGWVARDQPGGYELAPAPRIRPEDVPSRLGERPTHDVSVHWLAEGEPGDVLRGIESFRRRAGPRRVEHVVVEVVPAPEVDWGDGVRVLPLDRDPGFGSARAAGLRQTMGAIAIVADGSVEAVGDPFAPIDEALADPGVGLCGPVGAVTDDLRTLRESAGPDVDAVEGYLMGLRRDLLDRATFHAGYRFYRWADVDLSFQVKALGLRVVRVEVPVRLHAHRAWARLDPEDRRRLSRRSHRVFLERFGDRTDLLVSPPS